MPRKPKQVVAPSPTTSPRTPLILRGDGRGGPVSITPAGVAVVVRMAAQGHEVASIGKQLGISAAAFRECRRRQEEVQDALDQGHAALSDELAHLLLTQARKGNTVAAIYLSKARCGWREGDPPEQRPNIVINLPGARSEADYMRTLNAKATDATPALPSPAKKEVTR